jgi:hypothetical protein
MRSLNFYWDRQVRVNPAYLRGMTVAMYGLPTSLKPRRPAPGALL